MKYSKEEKKEIRDAFKTILDDMNEMWSEMGKPDLDVHIEIPKIEKVFPDYPKFGWVLIFNKSGIYLENSSFYNNIKLYLQKNSVVGKPITHLKNCEAGAIFIEKYPYIRERILNRLETIALLKKSAQEVKEAQLQNIKRIRDLYTKEIHVEVSNPLGINQNGIEITQENGKNIGTMHIGPSTIRIITNSKISFQDKSLDDVKVKRK